MQNPILTRKAVFTWLLNIARNAAIDKTRSKAFKNKKKNLNHEYFVDILEHKSSFSSKIDAIGIQKYIDILEPICKKVIDLLFLKVLLKRKHQKN